MRHHLIADVLLAIRRIEHRIVARVAICSHLAYYVLVTAEAHGTYRYAAGVVAVVVIVEALHGDEGTHHEHS